MEWRENKIPFLFRNSVYFPIITTSDAAETVILQLKWKHQFQFAGYYAAIEKGYYAEEGLEVELIEGKPGGNEIEEVLSGRANFGVGMADVLFERLKGHESGADAYLAKANQDAYRKTGVKNRDRNTMAIFTRNTK